LPADAGLLLTDDRDGGGTDNRARLGLDRLLQILGARDAPEQGLQHVADVGEQLRYFHAITASGRLIGRPAASPSRVRPSNRVASPDGSAVPPYRPMWKTPRNGAP